jgi:probable selenium-dependent hydroxylase accessory protein YqeC
MFRLAAEFAATGRSLVTTTTTKIFPPHADQSSALLLLENDPLLETLPRLMTTARHVTVARRVLPNGKLDGVSDADLNSILPFTDLVLVEADGAVGRCVKAPEFWEPVIPASADLVIPVVGLDCVGKPASNATVFRLHRFLEVTGIDERDPITPDVLARLFSSSAGSLRGVLPRARVVPLLNKLDRLDPQYALDHIAEVILSRMGSRATRIVAARLHEPIEALVYEVGPEAGGIEGSGTCP